MVIDSGTENAMVVTGSFNWSSSATIANDETLLVLHGERVANEIEQFFGRLWNRGDEFGNDFAGPNGTVQPGDVIFNEIHWDGWNGLVDPSDAGDDDVYNDEFIELFNTTDRTIDLSMWVIGSEDDFAVGIFPGIVIGPHERFLLADHNVEPYSDTAPQLGNSAFQNPDFVMNTANDTRFLRLNLSNADFFMQLVDPRGNVIDTAGDGGVPFYGGRQDVGGEIRNFSMERIHFDCAGDPDCTPIGPGDDPGSWAQCTLEEGGAHVRDAFRERIIASPGEANSVNDGGVFPAEPADFRAPAN